jgi:hypothetical protein
MNKLSYILGRWLFGLSEPKIDPGISRFKAPGRFQGIHPSPRTPASATTLELNAAIAKAWFVSAAIPHGDTPQKASYYSLILPKVASGVTRQSNLAQFGTAIVDLCHALAGPKEVLDHWIVSESVPYVVRPYAVIEAINRSIIRQEQSAPYLRIIGGCDVYPRRTANRLMNGMVFSLQVQSWPFPNCPAKLNSSTASFYFPLNAPKTITGLAVWL